MKKMFLLAAAALVAFASCSKSDVEKADEAKAIGFNSYTGRAVTKADASLFIPGAGSGTTDLLDNTHFGVYAYATEGAAFDGSNTSNVFMRNVDVEYKGGGASDETKYVYSPYKYWPNDEEHNKLTFFAYYPYNNACITNKPANGWGAYTFTAQTDPADMVDFMISEVAADQVYSTTNSGTPGVVQMHFHHALSMVKFKVNTDEDYSLQSTVIKLRSLKVAAIKKTGKLTPQIASPFATWDNLDGATTFTIFEDLTTAFASLNPTLTKTAVTFPTQFENDDAYLMIPQELGNEVLVTVVYDVKSGDDAIVRNTKEFKLNLAVKHGTSTPITSWAMNQNTVYTFTIGLKKIQFIADVTKWDSETAGDYLIQ